jgi:hypothetical protein
VDDIVRVYVRARREEREAAERAAASRARGGSNKAIRVGGESLERTPQLRPPLTTMATMNSRLVRRRARSKTTLVPRSALEQDRISATFCTPQALPSASTRKIWHRQPKKA